MMGIQHEKANNYIALSTAIASVALSLHESHMELYGLPIAAGIWFGGNYLSPDMDLEGSRSFKRWGILKPLWIPYAKSVKHRSKESHSILYSSFLRVLYMIIALAPFVGVPLLYLNQRLDLDLFFQRHWLEFVLFYLGIEISTWIHLALDWYGSMTKRIKRRLSTGK